MAKYPKRKKNPSLHGKSFKNPRSSSFTDKSSLKKVFIHPCYYDELYNPVCPNCGQYNTNIIYSSGIRESSSLYYVCACLTPYCRTVFKRPGGD